VLFPCVCVCALDVVVIRLLQITSRAAEYIRTHGLIRGNYRNDAPLFSMARVSAIFHVHMQTLPPSPLHSINSILLFNAWLRCFLIGKLN